VPNIFEPIADAIRRISVFVGLGTNAAHDARLQEYRLPGPGEMRYIPDLSEEEVRTYKTDFGKWILTNGLRELVEAYEVSLDQMYTECVRLYSQLGKSHSRKGKPFDLLHLHKKLVALKDEFGIATETEIELQSLMKARHCLSHRRGVVAFEDCNTGDSLVLNFRKLRIFVKQPSGEELEILDAIEQKIVLDDGGQVCAQLQKVKKEFPIGSVITLSPDEIQDVLWTVYQSAAILRERFEAFIRSEVETRNSTSVKREE
jgi:hypothetical protein